MMTETVPQWAQQLQTHFTELEQFLFDVPQLRDKTITNFNELEKISKTISIIKENTKLVPRILEVVIANYAYCDRLSKRIDELENSKTN